MSDSFDEQFNDLTNSIGNLNNIGSIKPNNTEETSDLINKLDELEKKDTDKTENLDINKDRDLINSIYSALEANDFVKTEALINEAQTKEVKNDKLYLAMVMFDMRVNTLDLLGECVEFYDYSQNSNNYKRAYKFSDKVLQDILNKYVNNSYCKNIYVNAKRIIDISKKEQDSSRLEEAANMLSELGNFKDSKSLCEECYSLLKKIKYKETNYEKLLMSRKFWNTSSLDTLNNYKKEIENLNSFKDSEDWLREISVIIEKKQNNDVTFHKIRQFISNIIKLQFLWILIVFFMALSKSHKWFTEESVLMSIYKLSALLSGFCFIGIIIGAIILVIMDIVKKFNK